MMNTNPNITHDHDCNEDVDRRISFVTQEEYSSASTSSGNEMKEDGAASQPVQQLEKQPRQSARLRQSPRRFGTSHGDFMTHEDGKKSSPSSGSQQKQQKQQKKQKQPQRGRKRSFIQTETAAAESLQIRPTSSSRGRTIRQRYTNLSYSTSSGEDNDEEMDENHCSSSSASSCKSLYKEAILKDDELVNNECKCRRSAFIHKEPSASKPKQSKTNESPSDKLNPDDRHCPHCEKIFSSFAGLSYHVNNFVCRQVSRPGGPVVRGRRPRNKSSHHSASGATITMGSKYKRIRGSVENRTCPNCRRIFTSILGLQYHTERRVCDATKSLTKSHPFHRIAAGSQFVTMYGIVQVVADQRDLELPPTMNPLPEVSDNRKKHKQMAKLKRQRIIATAANLFRRKTLSQLYMTNQINAKTVQQAYHPGALTSSGIGDQMPNSESCKERFTAVAKNSNPPAPADYYPDRMVECVLIQDERKRITVYSDSTLKESETNPNVSVNYRISTHLFLKRRELDDSYSREDTVYSCWRCGQLFMTRPGIMYHIRSGGCTRERVLAVKQSCQERLKEIAHVIERLSQPRTEPAKLVIAKKKKPRKMSEISMYPQVWLSLGYNLLPKSEETSKEGIISAYSKKRSHGEIFDEALPNTIQKRKVEALDPAFHPRVILEKLKGELRYEQSRIVGAMYPGVYMSLGFREFNPRKAAEERERAEIALKKKLNQTKRRKEAQRRQMIEDTVNAPAIDIHVIVNEVNTGRFRSLKRYYEAHDNFCSICKGESGIIHPCDYCRQTVHLSCMRRRWNVQDPEPCTGFMCQTCLGMVMARRNRAEKRNEEKNSDVNQTLNVAEKIDLLSTEDVDGREYAILEAHGQRVSELTVLLKDAQSRLTDCLATSTSNTLQLSMIDPTRDWENRGLR